MFVTELDVVNACIATLGEAPLVTLEDDHTYKAAAQNYLNKTRLEMLGRGWWFNTEAIYLTPDAISKYVYIPQDALNVRSLEYRGYSLAQRGRRIYNTQHNTYEFLDRVRMVVFRNLPFDDLPHHAQEYVRDRTVLTFQREYDGDGNRTRELAIDAQSSWANLKAEQLRQVKPNLLDRVSVRRAVQSFEAGALTAAEMPHPHRTN